MDFNRKFEIMLRLMTENITKVVEIKKVFDFDGIKKIWSILPLASPSTHFIASIAIELVFPIPGLAKK